MTENPYPFELINTFFISLNLRREKHVPDPLELPVSIQMKVSESGFPRLQVNLKVSVPKDSPLAFDIELVGLFDYIGDSKEYDHDLNWKFINDRGFFILFPYVSQMIRLITSQMGMNPLNTRMPLEASFSKLETEKAPENN